MLSLQRQSSMIIHRFCLNQAHIMILRVDQTILVKNMVFSWKYAELRQLKDVSPDLHAGRA